MSGECTVTPGKTWAAETITDAKLNLTANPVVRVNENAITARELDLASITPEIAETAKARNWCRNPTFAERYVSATHSSGVLLQTAAAGWWRRATGTAVIASTIDGVLNDGVAETCLGISCGTPGTSTGGIRVGQFFDEGMARHLALQTVTVSFWFRNNTGGATTPRIQIHAWQAADDRGTPVQVYDEATTSVADATGTWTRLSKTIDLSGLSNVGYGFDLVIEVPASLTSLGQVWRISGVQLEISAAATEFTAAHAAGWSQRRHKYSGSATAPTWDITDGFLAGDRVTGVNRVWSCLDPADGAPVWHRDTLPYNGLRWIQSAEFVPSAAQTLTTSYADLDGSSVSYTPKSATSRVLYRYVFHLATDVATEALLAHLQLLVDGTPETNSKTTLGAGGWNNGDIPTVYEHSLASWGLTAKTLKLQVREFSSATDSKAHATYNMDGSASAALKNAQLTIIETETAE